MCQLTGTLKQREKLWDRGLEKKVVQAMQIVNQYTTDTLPILHQQFTNTSLTHYWYYLAQLVGWFVNRFLTDTALTVKCHLIDITTDSQLILDQHSTNIAMVKSTDSQPRCQLIHWLTPLVRHDPLNLESAILDKIDVKFIPPSAPPQNQGWENGVCCLLRSFILDLGGWKFAVPLYSVQDCGLTLKVLTTRS